MSNVHRIYPQPVPEPYVLPANGKTDGRFYRIVACKRGDCVSGFRVQRESWSCRLVDNDGGFVWRNIGRKLYSLQAAREYRDFLIRNSERAGETLEAVE